MNLSQLEKQKNELIEYIKEVRLQHDNMIKLKRDEKLAIMTDIRHMLEAKKQIIKELMTQKKEIMRLIREHKKQKKQPQEEIITIKKKIHQLKSKPLKLKNIEYPQFEEIKLQKYEPLQYEHETIPFMLETPKYERNLHLYHPLVMKHPKLTFNFSSPNPQGNEEYMSVQRAIIEKRTLPELKKSLNDAIESDFIQMTPLGDDVYSVKSGRMNIGKIDMKNLPSIKNIILKIHEKKHKAEVQKNWKIKRDIIDKHKQAFQNK
jgi:hypothetical protein